MTLDLSAALGSSLGVLLAVVLALLLLGTLIAYLLPHWLPHPGARDLLTNLRQRTNSWWLMIGVFSGTILLGPRAVIVLYALISFLALREYYSLTPTHRADHRALFWSFFVFLPTNYALIWVGWFDLFVIFIPVYAFVFLPIRQVLAGATDDFLARTGRLQWGLLVAVYFLSHIPWLLRLQFPAYQLDPHLHPAGLLFWMVLVTQANDVFQYVWGKLLGRHALAPTVSPKKTWEGFIGGSASATILGGLLGFATPFGHLGAAAMALILCLLGTAGGLVMSAIKRDLKVKDWGGSLPGHGGILDRVDSLLFSAPWFFHLAAFYFHGELVNTASEGFKAIFRFGW